MLMIFLSNKNKAGASSVSTDNFELNIYFPIFFPFLRKKQKKARETFCTGPHPCAARAAVNGHRPSAGKGRAKCALTVYTKMRAMNRAQPSGGKPPRRVAVTVALILSHAMLFLLGVNWASMRSSSATLAPAAQARAQAAD